MTFYDASTIIYMRSPAVDDRCPIQLSTTPIEAKATIIEPFLEASSQNSKAHWGKFHTQIL